MKIKLVDLKESDQHEFPLCLPRSVLCLLFWPIWCESRVLGTKATLGSPSFTTQRKKQWDSCVAVCHVRKSRDHTKVQKPHASSLVSTWSLGRPRSLGRPQLSDPRSRWCEAPGAAHSTNRTAPSCLLPLLRGSGPCFI